MTDIAAVEGFKTPVFVTRRAWAIIEYLNRTLARVDAVLWHLRFQVVFEGGDPTEVRFNVSLDGSGEVITFVAAFVVRDGMEGVQIDLEDG
ncbi:MAG: hypothetical protein L6R48_13465 [Planctomycetes bacterium]|nr:hypothetical protein [Planctomycetota bacterium]